MPNMMAALPNIGGALCSTFMCGSMVDIQCPTAEIRRGNTKRRKKKPQDENIYVHVLQCRATIN